MLFFFILFILLNTGIFSQKRKKITSFVIYAYGCMQIDASNIIAEYSI